MFFLEVLDNYSLIAGQVCFVIVSDQGIVSTFASSMEQWRELFNL